MRRVREATGDETSFDLTEIKASFDALVSGGCDMEAFSASMIGRCRENSDVAWELLALIDQYGRRGQLDKQDLSALKSQIRQEAFRRSLPASGSSPVAAQRNVPPATTATAMIRDRVLPILRNDAPDHANNRPAAGPTTRVTRDAAELVVEAGATAIARLAYSRGRDNAPATAPEAREVAQRGRCPAVGAVLQRRFVLEQQLGSGGMGTVFRALDRNKADLPEAERYVALKVLRQHLASRPDAVERLRREFLETQRLSHPGIINVHDLDVDAGVHFFTMELLAGEALSSVLARMSPQRLERSVADTILLDIGSALSYAHDRGVLHADLKPGNVVITRDGGLRVLDFGAATPVRREPWIAEPGQSFNGVTRAYASCERLAGEAPDMRDDIFSYACLAYELLAGAHPFDRLSALQAREEGIRPRRIPDLSRRQWRALSQALAWDRADRQESLAALVRDLVPTAPAARLPAPDLLQSRAPVNGSGHKATWGVAMLGALAVLIAVAVVLPTRVLPPQAETVRTWLADAGEDATAATRSGMTRLRQWTSSFYSAPVPEPSQPTIASSSPEPAAPPAAVLALESVAITPLVTAPVEVADATPPPVAEPVARPTGIPGRVELAAGTLSVLESSPVARIVVERRGDVDSSASFSWTTLSGSALENQDYAAFGVVTEAFAPGQSTAAILVPIVRDSEVEGAETFYVEITAATGQARLGSLTRTTVFIEDDDLASAALVD